jgi:hypothetical protein
MADMLALVILPILILLPTRQHADLHDAITRGLAASAAVCVVDLAVQGLLVLAMRPGARRHAQRVFGVDSL